MKRFFHDKTDGFKTNINKGTAHAQMRCGLPHRDRTTTQWTINYVRYQQTSTNVGVAAIRSSRMYANRSKTRDLRFFPRVFFGGGSDRENKVIGVDLIHICLSKMEPSAVKFQCQALAVNPNEQINSVSSAVSLLELSGSLASLARRGALCESLPRPLLRWAFNLAMRKNENVRRR